MNALGSLGETLVDLLKLKVTYDRARPLLEAEPEYVETKAAPAHCRAPYELIICHFDIRLRQRLCSRMYLSKSSRQFVALVGPSGAGKSTLLRLLLGFETASEGKIYYDEYDLDTLDLRELRRKFGVVLQNGTVKAGTIYDNIRGVSSISQDEAWQAAAAASLAEEIDAMPMKMSTVLGPGGTTISGGQRQRLMIARAVAGSPKLLFFDEATSALDNRSQAAVSESLGHLDATRVVIAHRLSTIKDADKIYVLDQGRVVENGTYEELMEAGGLFGACQTANGLKVLNSFRSPAG